MITPGGEIVISGDKTNCDECGKEYTYFIWALGSDRCYCKPCLRSAHTKLDCVDDMIDLDREEQDMLQEIEEQRLKDYGPRV